MKHSTGRPGHFDSRPTQRIPIITLPGLCYCWEMTPQQKDGSARGNSAFLPQPELNSLIRLWTSFGDEESTGCGGHRRQPRLSLAMKSRRVYLPTYP